MTLRVVGGTEVPPVRGSVAADVPLGKPERPKWADDNEELGQLFDETVTNLEAAGLLSTADAMTIEALCRHTIMLRMAFREVLATGTVIVPATGNGDAGVDKKHPAEAVFRMESAALLELLKQAGMTWAARARTPAKRAGEAEGGNPFGAVASGE